MSNYFRQVPDFDYVSRLPDAKISDYLTVKNLFKKGKLADDIFQDLTIFTKYEIELNLVYLSVDANNYQKTLTKNKQHWASNTSTKYT